MKKKKGKGTTVLTLILGSLILSSVVVLGNKFYKLIESYELVKARVLDDAIIREEKEYSSMSFEFPIDTNGDDKEDFYLIFKMHNVSEENLKRQVLTQSLKKGANIVLEANMDSMKKYKVIECKSSDTVNHIVAVNSYQLEYTRNKKNAAELKEILAQKTR